MDFINNNAFQSVIIIIYIILIDYLVSNKGMVCSLKESFLFFVNGLYLSENSLSIP